MSYLLFVDESGLDNVSPYEVLAGICISDRLLWSFIQEVQQTEKNCFGERYSPGLLELKGKKLLKKKTFRLASQMSSFDESTRTDLAHRCLEKGKKAKGDPAGGHPTQEELTALAQAKLAFVTKLLDLCRRYHIQVLASIVDRDAPRPEGEYLRKDYAYLLERFYYFLEDTGKNEHGLVVFDELEKVQCHILVDQMGRYFRETTKGRERSSLVIPEPFFVHSHLTTAVQVADIIAYIIVWGVRIGDMQRTVRPELRDYAQQVCNLRYKAVRGGILGYGRFDIWSFAIIDDLRPRTERDGSRVE